MKHIWWINHHAIPPVVPGGTRHYSLAKEIMKLGDYKVTIINGSFDHLTSHFEEGAEWGAKLQVPILRNYDGVDFYTLPTPYYDGNASFGRLKNMWTFYKNAIKFLSPHKSSHEITEPDIIIGSTVHPFAAYAGYKLSQHYHVSFVYEVRDLWPLTLVEIGKISKYNPIALIFGYLDKKMANVARLIITTAPLMKNYYINNYHINANKFIWITNGSSLIHNSRLLYNEDSKLDETKHIVRVGYVGTMGLANGIDTFLYKLNTIDKTLLKKFKFIFVGNGPQKSKLMNYCRKENMLISFMEPVSKNKIAGVLEQFDLLLVIIKPSPIYKYGTSLNKLADYQAIGKPILMIGDVAMNPVIEANSGFICKTLNDLEVVLKEIINSSVDDIQSKASNAKAYAMLNYDWKQLANRLNQELKSI